MQATLKIQLTEHCVISVSVSDDRATLTMTNPNTGQQMGGFLSDAERAALLGVLAGEPTAANDEPHHPVLPEVRLRRLEMDYRDVVSLRDLLQSMVDNDGHEFRLSSDTLRGLRAMEREQLCTLRLGAGVCVWHATADGREALGLKREG
jgi:hypothetical protein